MRLSNWIYVVDVNSGNLIGKMKFDRKDIFPLDKNIGDLGGKQVKIHNSFTGAKIDNLLKPIKSEEFLLYRWMELNVEPLNGKITVEYLNPSSPATPQSNPSIVEFKADLFEVSFEVVP